MPFLIKILLQTELKQILQRKMNLLENSKIDFRRKIPAEKLQFN